MWVTSRNQIAAALWVSAATFSTIVPANVASAIVIDDFSVGPITVVGPDNEIQTGLDPAHVLGGSRTMNVGQFGSGSVLEIEPTSGLNFHSTGNGYYRLRYDFNSTGQGIDLTQGGQDRLRLAFGDVATPSIFLLSLVVTLTPTSSNNGISLSFGNWSDLILEVPYAAFPTSLIAAESLTLDVARNPPGASHTLKSITTAGTPLAGDYNRDGTVDSVDYMVWRRFFGISTKNGLTFAIASADGNADGRVDVADYTIWRKHMGTGSAAGSTANHFVPEPAALSIILCGLFNLSLLMVRRRWRTELVS
jgi:Dockerin type I domain